MEKRTPKETSNQQNGKSCKFGLIEPVHGRSGKFKLHSTPVAPA